MLKQNQIPVQPTNGNVGITMTNENGHLKIDFYELPPNIKEVCVVENPNGHLEWRSLHLYKEGEPINVKLSHSTQKVGLLLIPETGYKYEDKILGAKSGPSSISMYRNEITITDTAPVLWVEEVSI